MVEIDRHGVRSRVAALTFTRDSRSVFGLSGHRFLLHPVLTESWAATVEALPVGRVVAGRVNYQVKLRLEDP